MGTYWISPAEQQSDQQSADTTFSGGLPRLPAHEPLPQCSRCSNIQTFFFQVAFPDDHAWRGRSLALFRCTLCYDRTGIPAMLNTPLLGAPIPAGFLQEYQTNFRVLVFDTTIGVMRDDAPQRVVFTRWQLVPADPGEAQTVVGSRVGVAPTWLLRDETPGLYGDRIPMIFLFQFEPLEDFKQLPDAPRRIWSVDGSRMYPDYPLFNNNASYFFGTCPAADPAVYILTQCD